MRLIMELTNDENESKIVFSKVGGKLNVTIEEDDNPSQYFTWQEYKNIDFEEFKKNIEKIESSDGV